MDKENLSTDYPPFDFVPLPFLPISLTKMNKSPSKNDTRKRLKEIFTAPAPKKKRRHPGRLPVLLDREATPVLKELAKTNKRSLNSMASVAVVEYAKIK